MGEDYQLDRSSFHMTRLNRVKNQLSPGTNQIQVKLEADMELKKDAETQLKACFESFGDIADKISIRDCRGSMTLRIPEVILCSLFDSILNPLKTALEEITQTTKYDFAFLVGGLGSNGYIQQQLISFLAICSSSTKFFSPPEASLAVVRGAIRFGLNPSSFILRRARTNYGVHVHNRKDPSQPMFSLWIRKGTDLAQIARTTKETPLGPYKPLDAKQNSWSISLYECEEVPIFISHPKCIFIAKIVMPIDLSVPFQKRKFDITISMSGPVIRGLARQISNNACMPIQWSSK